MSILEKKLKTQHNLNQEIQQIEFDQQFKFFDLLPPNEEELITINEKVVLSSRNMMMISGLPKSNKSTVALMFLFSFIANKNVQGIKVKKTGKALYIDTELSNLSFYKAFHRARVLSGVKELDYDCFNVYLLRMLDKDKIISNLIFLLEHNEDYKYVFIDGILDLCNDFNNVEETKQLMSMLQAICEKRDVSIISVMHLGKTNGYALGHVGSSAQRKMESCINVSKDSDESNAITITPKFLRSDAHFQDIRFNTVHLYEQNKSQVV